MVADREQRMFQRLLLGRPVLIPGDGTTLSQVGHVDGAVALRMLMMQPQAFGKRYNLTGRDYWGEEPYVDTFGEIIGGAFVTGLSPQRIPLVNWALSIRSGVLMPAAEQPLDRVHRLGDVGGRDALLGPPPRRCLNAEHDIRADRVGQRPHREFVITGQQSPGRRLSGVATPPAARPVRRRAERRRSASGQAGRRRLANRRSGPGAARRW